MPQCLLLLNPKLLTRHAYYRHAKGGTTRRSKSEWQGYGADIHCGMCNGTGRAKKSSCMLVAETVLTRTLHFIISYWRFKSHDFYCLPTLTSAKHTPRSLTAGVVEYRKAGKKDTCQSIIATQQGARLNKELYLISTTSAPWALPATQNNSFVTQVRFMNKGW